MGARPVVRREELKARQEVAVRVGGQYLLDKGINRTEGAVAVGVTQGQVHDAREQVNACLGRLPNLRLDSLAVDGGLGIDEEEVGGVGLTVNRDLGQPPAFLADLGRQARGRFLACGRQDGRDDGRGIVNGRGRRRIGERGVVLVLLRRNRLGHDVVKQQARTGCFQHLGRRLVRPAPATARAAGTASALVRLIGRLFTRRLLIRRLRDGRFHIGQFYQPRQRGRRVHPFGRAAAPPSTPP